MPEKNRRLLVAMARKGWNSRRLAAEAGMAESSISNILNQQIRPTQATKQRIAAALDSSVPSIFGGKRA
jgi:transcriptional regulator with XRE-family HTH domain